MVHTKVHPKNQFGCDKCDWHFNLIAGLALHGRDCHDTRQNACHWCTNYFDSVEKLHSHNQRHHHFPCTACFDYFPTADELKDHVETKHGGHQPTEEEQRLQRQQEERRTKLQQEESRCEKREAPVQEQYHGCQHCLQNFSSRKLLDDHIATEHTFICGVCLRVFTIEEERRNHMNNDHPISSQSEEENQ